MGSPPTERGEESSPGKLGQELTQLEFQLVLPATIPTFHHVSTSLLHECLSDTLPKVSSGSSGKSGEAPEGK